MKKMVVIVQIIDKVYITISLLISTLLFKLIVNFKKEKNI